ncbi:MAG TPA: hypothetical protein VE379_01490 [Vicinamibacterales bacterium]|nr:hypothetical protein [Vicinamibacterales bacterium]
MPAPHSRAGARECDSRRVWLVALLWTVAIAARVVVGPHVVDDAYITMRYSRNLVATGALSYNPPDAVLGTSTPLWTAMLAATAAGGATPEQAAVVLSAAADLASIAVIVATAGPSFAAAAAALTIAARPAYVAYGLSGMETSLYVLLLVTFAATLSRGSVVGGGMAAALGALCRPDGALLGILGCGWFAATRGWRTALRFAAVVSLMCVPWALYAFVTFGSILPASVEAKAAAGDVWSLSLQNLVAYFLRGADAPVTALAAVGAAMILMTGTAFWKVWTLWMLAYLTVMTAANAFTHFPWYFVPVLPVAAASAACAAERGWCALARLLRRPIQPPLEHTPMPSAPGHPAATVLVVAVLGAVLLARMPVLRADLDAQSAGREALYASIAAGLAAEDSGCTVAATEIGTLGYHYPGRILDLVGLVSPEAIGRPAEAILAERRPRWLVTYDTHFDSRLAASVAFTDVYATRALLPVGAARQLAVFERRDRAGCAP